MRITRWAEYGMHCAAYIAQRHNAGHETVGAVEISESQGIALEYTQQIMQRLRKGGIVESVRGPYGGYKLSRPAEKMSLKDIIVATEGDTFEVICQTKPLDTERCRTPGCCNLRGVWLGLKAHVDEYFLRFTLSDIIVENPQAAKKSTVKIGEHNDSNCGRANCGSEHKH